MRFDHLERAHALLRDRLGELTRAGPPELARQRRRVSRRGRGGGRGEGRQRSAPSADAAAKVAAKPSSNWRRVQGCRRSEVERGGVRHEPPLGRRSGWLEAPSVAPARANALRGRIDYRPANSRRARPSSEEPTAVSSRPRWLEAPARRSGPRSSWSSQYLAGPGSRGSSRSVSPRPLPPSGLLGRSPSRGGARRDHTPHPRRRRHARPRPQPRTAPRRRRRPPARALRAADQGELLPRPMPRCGNRLVRSTSTRLRLQRLIGGGAVPSVVGPFDLYDGRITLQWALFDPAAIARSGAAPPRWKRRSSRTRTPANWWCSPSPISMCRCSRPSG